MKIEIHKIADIDFGAFDEATHKALGVCARMSEQIFCGRMNGRVVCIWGIITPTILSDRAYLWLTTNECIEQNKFLFIRHSQRVIKGLLKQYPEVVGHVEFYRQSSVRWLKLLGAKFGGCEGKLMAFTISRD